MNETQYLNVKTNDLLWKIDIELIVLCYTNKITFWKLCDLSLQIKDREIM